MAKGWRTIATNDLSYGVEETREEKIAREQRFNNAIRNTAVAQDESKLIKQTLEDAAEADARKEQLIDAYNKKKLKSKRLIREARSLKQKPAKKAATA